MEESEDFDSFKETQAIGGSGGVPPDGGDKIGFSFDDDDQEPERIGRYRIQRKIGMGGFGEVFLAHDDSLQRTVAIKVINRGAFDKSEDGLMEEGRTLAQLDHPGIVTIHDIGKDNGRIYFVSPYVAGRTLRRFMREETLTPEKAAALIAEISEALGYAHKRSVIHRDIKPTNIIVTPEGKPILIDFGVALAMGQDMGAIRRRAILGTPSYMSPEQARGESHLVDGRSDIYGLGVILYEMLTGVRPFEGRTEDLIDKVASPTLEARPPRQIDEEIPKSIERICLKSLAKRTVDRYSTAQDLKEDLRAFVNKSREERTGETKTFQTGIVIPKGLRSFDESDSEFFLQLLPGLRDQAGIPDSIRFWQRGIENRADPFRVGVLYGPSGSGKSSFLKAGLLPLLPDATEVIYVAAVAGNTEALLAERLRDRFPEFDEDDSLSECVRRIRMEKQLKNTGKLLIVIDQFEQWLHANGRAPESELVAALRQCDGKSVQVLLTLRDDFWMAIGQLMEDIDVEMLQSKNTAAIDLFDRAHARRVLIEFGRAYERIPAGEEELSEGHSDFVRAALTDMEQDGKTIPLHLALFAEMAKSVDWTRETYEKLGGTTAIGAEFLNSVFSSRTANPAHRAVEKPARSILEALLPSAESQIRGRPLDEAELMKKSGLSENPARFASTIRILDDELKLITPVDTTSESDKDSESEKRYQLTHDYLVPSLRGWLFESHRSTFKGRAFLRLNELSGAWRGSRDSRHLPSLQEWVRILSLVPRSRWTGEDKKMIAAASRRQIAHAGMFLAVAGLIIGLFVFAGSRSLIRTETDQILKANTADVPRLLTEFESRPEKIRYEIEHRRKLDQLDREQRLNAAVVLLQGGDKSEAEYAFEQLRHLSVDSCETVIRQLSPFRGELTQKAWSSIRDSRLSSVENLRSAAFLAQHDPRNGHWDEFESEPVRWLLSAPSRDISAWARLLKPAKETFISGLFDRLRRQNAIGGIENRSSESNVVEALAELLSEDPEKLVSLLWLVSDSKVEIVARRLDEIPDLAIPILEDSLPERAATRMDELAETDSTKTSRALAALLRLGKKEVPWKWISKRENPQIANEFVLLVQRFGIDPEEIWNRLATEQSPFSRRILTLALGEYDPGLMDPDLRSRAIDWQKKMLKEEEDPGVHSSIAWLLDRWGENSELTNQVTPIGPVKRLGVNYWTRNFFGDEFAVIHVRTNRGDDSLDLPNFAIGMREVTVEQFTELMPIHDKRVHDTSPEPDCPVTGISMIEAMQFCNELSLREGLGNDQLCYGKIELSQGIRYEPKVDFLSREGYRLPTETEWNYAALSGLTLEQLENSLRVSIDRVSWYNKNTIRRQTSPIGVLWPNDNGIFDIFGNAGEWCHHLGDDTTGSRNSKVFATLCGGTVGSSFEAMVQMKGDGFLPNSHPEFGGLRLARTIFPEGDISN